jgi:uncharacterized protein (DUF2267 family)
VQYDDFVSSVQVRGGRPRDETEALVHATLRVPAERLTAGEADDLRAQLPGDLQADLIPPEPEAQPFGPDEFARRVARTARVPEAEAREAMVTVLATTRDAVQPGEFDDVLPQLGVESSLASCRGRARSDGDCSPHTSGAASHAGRPEL